LPKRRRNPPGAGNNGQCDTTIWESGVKSKASVVEAFGKTKIQDAALMNGHKPYREKKWPLTTAPKRNLLKEQ